MCPRKNKFVLFVYHPFILNKHCLIIIIINDFDVVRFLERIIVQYILQFLIFDKYITSINNKRKIWYVSCTAK